MADFINGIVEHGRCIISKVLGCILNGSFQPTTYINLLTTLSYRSKSQQFEIASPGLDQKGFSLWDASVVYELPGGHWTFGLHGKNLADKRYIVSGYNFMNVNPYTGEFINNGAVRGAAFGVPGLESALGREGVLTAYYGNPRQVMFTVGYKL